MPQAHRFFLLAGLCLLLAGHAAANIYLDENFEDGTPFTDHNWAIVDDTTPPTQGDIAAKQGINVRGKTTQAFDPDLVGVYVDPVAMANTGTVADGIAFAGTRSLRFQSSQSMSISGNGTYSQAEGGWYKALQFAVTVDAATLALDAGTQVGSLKQDYSTEGNNSTIDVTYQLNLVRNGSGGVDLVVNANGATVGTIQEAGQWLMVSVIAINRTDSDETNWEGWDPLTETYKGPQPTGDPFGGSGTYAVLDGGIHVFVNSNTAANFIAAEDVGATWAHSNGTGDADEAVLVTWSLGAENGGSIYVDEMFWSHAQFQNQNGTGQANQDAAARMNAFDAVPAGPVVNRARSWSWLD